jgi:hypothetical protein
MTTISGEIHERTYHRRITRRQLPDSYELSFPSQRNEQCSHTSLPVEGQAREPVLLACMASGWYAKTHRAYWDFEESHEYRN